MDPRRLRTLLEPVPIKIKPFGEITLAPRTEVCPDCNRSVTDRTVEIELKKPGTPRAYWRKNCLVCRKKTRISPKKSK